MEDYPKYSTESYSEESELNTVDICIPRKPSPSDSTKYWIIYIHGGGWRDPEVSSSAFKATQDKLLSSQVSDSIAGYASINYRLSPYPSHPTNPSHPADPARTAVHPDHIKDVLHGILYLQDKFGFEGQYVLAGHSCGATLAFQVAMKRYWGANYESTFALELNVVPPVAIVGLSGLYDLPALVRYHKDQPVYEDFVVGAFGSTGWEKVSPTSGDYEESWEDGKVVILAHSRDDGLVEMEQPELMGKMLVKQGWGETGERTLKTVELKGEHDDIWRTGEPAKAVIAAVEELMKP